MPSSSAATRRRRSAAGDGRRALARPNAGYAARAEAAEAAVAARGRSGARGGSRGQPCHRSGSRSECPCAGRGAAAGQAEQRWRRLDEQFARLREERDRIGAQAIDPAAARSRRAEQSAAETALAAARDGAGCGGAGARGRPVPRSPLRASGSPPPTSARPGWQRRRARWPRCWRSRTASAGRRWSMR